MKYTQLLFITICIYLINATSIQNDENCFNVKEKSNQEGTVLTINGEGKMCNCKGNDLQQYQSSIETITFGDSITSIGERCFEEFTQLSQINFGKGITEINEFAFSRSGLTSLIIPETITVIKSHAFEQNNKLVSIDITESQEEIIVEENAFKNCESLESFKIPKRLQNFNSNMLNGCDNLKTLTISEEHEQYQIKENVLFSKDGKKLIYYPKGLLNDYYAVPNGVETIEKDVFSYSSITGIDYNSELRQLNQNSFYYNKIKSLYIPKSVELIESHAFAMNIDLETVIITSDNIIIEEEAFEGCKNLKNVIISSNTIQLQNNVFANCESLKQIRTSTSNDISIEGKETTDGLASFDECFLSSFADPAFDKIVSVL